MRTAQLVSALLAAISISTCSLTVLGQNNYRVNRAADGMPPMAPSPAPAFTTPPAEEGSGGGLMSPEANANPQQSVGDSGWANAFNTPNAALTPEQKQQTMVRVHAPQPHPLEGKTNEMQGGITQRDLVVLGQHDVSVIVDRSLSMSTCDCPGYVPGQNNWQRALVGLMAPGVGMPQMPQMNGGGMSRWQFVQQQAMALSKQTQEIFPQGITVELFSSANSLRVFHNVDIRQMPEIFAQNHPWGHTDTTGALEAQFNEYFAHRNATGGKCKPLAIAIITDGCPDNPGSLRNLIIEATRAMRNPHEITITFLQIGLDRGGYELLHDLDQNLVRAGAKYDIVDSKPFPEVVQAGLARSLVDAISANGKSNAAP